MDSVRLILKYGADIKVKGKTFLVSLHCACWFHHLDLVRLLAERATDVNVEGKNEDTPLISLRP